MASMTLPESPDSALQESRLQLATTAFLAIVRRDLVVLRNEFVPFLLQSLIQPLFTIFIFGKVFPGIGFTRPGFAALLLPGVVGLTTMTVALQGVTLPLVLDLGFAREIDDRLLAPLPTPLVALEKLLFAALRGLVGGAVIFPLGWWILGDQYQVSTDHLGLLVVMMILAALLGASLGLALGTLIKPEQIGLMFALILTPLLFTGCTYYPWSTLTTLKWFQVVTLFNPLTYATEGMRAAMVPAIHGQTLTTLALPWVFLGLVVPITACTLLGMRTFRNRVVS